MQKILAKRRWLHTAWTVSAIFNLVITTPSLRRHILLTVTFFSTSLSLPFPPAPAVPRMPISYSFSRRSDSCLCRTGSAGSRAAREWASCLQYQPVVQQAADVAKLQGAVGRNRGRHLLACTSNTKSIPQTPAYPIVLRII